MSEPVNRPCRSVSADGKPCVRTKKQHMSHSDGQGGHWEYGINKPAVAFDPNRNKNRPKRTDDGHMTEADYILQDRYHIF